MMSTIQRTILNMIQKAGCAFSEFKLRGDDAITFRRGDGHGDVLVRYFPSEDLMQITTKSHGQPINRIVAAEKHAISGYFSEFPQLLASS